MSMWVVAKDGAVRSMAADKGLVPPLWGENEIVDTAARSAVTVTIAPELLV
jgi:hypothetical protein